MANKVFNEVVQLCFQPIVTDAAGGKKASGTVTIVDTQTAFVEEKKYRRTDQSGKLVFQTLIMVSFWVNPEIDITTKHFLKWRDKKLTIQDISKDEMELKWILNCVKDGN